MDRVEHNQSFSDFTHFTMVIIFLKIIEKNLYGDHFLHVRLYCILLGTKPVSCVITYS